MVKEILKELLDLNYTYMYLTMLILVYYISSIFAFHIKLAIRETKKELGEHHSVKTWTVIYYFFKGTSLFCLAFAISLLAFYLVKFYEFI